MYSAKRVKSESKTIADIATWEKLTTSFGDENAKAVVWYYDKIEFYYISKGAWDRPPRIDLKNEVLRARIFNTRAEVHIWQSNGVLKGRLREDMDGSEMEFVRTEQIMNGTDFVSTGNYLRVMEQKGTDYFLPFEELLGQDAKIDRLKLITRNYIDYNKIGQAGYTDCRFEDIEILEK